jgi:dihydrofolate reductase
MTVNAILAHDDNYGIGKDGLMPWPHNDADMKWFRDCTKGHIVVMGRKTWESIGSKKLPNRINVVVTRSKIGGDPDSVYYGTMFDLVRSLKEKYPDLKIWIIGGADIYRQTMDMCDNIYVTKFPGDYECDTFVPMNKHLIGYTEMAKKVQGGLTFSIWSRF